MADAQRAARAITEAVNPSRMNFAVLGNAVPHLHFHLIARFADREPIRTSLRGMTTALRRGSILPREPR